MAQQLILKTSKIPALLAQDGAADATVFVKLFTPMSSWTWLLTEYDPATGEAFGFAYNSQDPECAELGYIPVTELAKMRSRHGMPMVERDIHFTPKPMSEARRIECNGF
jgi:hypothetical protein